MDSILAFISMPGGGEWIIIGIIGLLLFGKRLPEVGSSLGKTIVEFKRGLRGIEDQIERASYAPPAAQSQSTLSEPTSGETAVTEHHEEHQTAEMAPEATAHEGHS